MINVAAIRMQQFGVQFYQASLTASDIDKLVRFEVLSYGDTAQPPVRGGKQKAGAVVMTGRELSINQAVDAFSLFTGVQPPDGAIADAFDRSLAAQEARHRAA